MYQAGGPPIAVGYHGTTKAAAEAILAKGFVPRSNPYDWLGDGVYFFQDAPERARKWAEEHFSKAEATVVAAEIDLTDCLDLFDEQWARFLADVYDSYLSFLRQTEMPLPVQRGGAHRLDREVINYAVQVLGEAGTIIRCVRAAFAEGHPVFPDSAILHLAHVQIAVRDPATCIRRAWIVGKEGSDG